MLVKHLQTIAVVKRCITSSPREAESYSNIMVSEGDVYGKEVSISKKKRVFSVQRTRVWEKHRVRKNWSTLVETVVS